MTIAGTVLREAAGELRAGLRSGVVGITFVGLAGYLLLALTNAEYMRELGATDIARNAPSVIYLMSTGCMFFLFFAWAWVFAQPVLRERHANLQEIIMTMPVRLPALLWGRFLGASIVAALLAASLIAGFVAAPVLSWAGLVPSSALTAPQWTALAFSWVVLLLLPGFGIGALYFLAALCTRSVAGPFAISALLMLLWMFATIALKGADVAPVAAAMIDPSLFTYVLTTVEGWTPAEKQNALLAPTPALLINRFLWCLLPVLLLAVFLPRVKRETLALGREPQRFEDGLEHDATVAADHASPPIADGTQCWPLALRWETCWQIKAILRARTLWVGVSVLLVTGVASGLVHAIWRATGPMVARPLVVLPVVNDALYLVMAFIMAALAGIVWRRDYVTGFEEMLDASAAPVWLRPFGRICALVATILLLALVPGVSSVLITTLLAPGTISLTTPFLYQLLVTAPAMLELGLLAVLVHAACTKAGVAYTLSMLLTFVLVVNHELQLVHSPLLEVGIPAHLHLSAVGGWGALLGYLLVLDFYKLGVCVLAVALAVLMLPRGVDRRRHPLGRLNGPVFGLSFTGLVLVVGPAVVLHAQLAAGANRSDAVQRAVDAGWERRWLETAGSYRVAGGTVVLNLDSETGVMHGQWTLRAVRAANGLLHAELPHGFELESVRVDGHHVAVETAFDHLAIPLNDCSRGCVVELEWTVAPAGWSGHGQPRWRSGSTLWLRAELVMPRLGVNPNRILRAPVRRKRQGLPAKPEFPPTGAAVTAEAIAPSGKWRWRVTLNGRLLAAADGQQQSPLDFAVAHSSQLVSTTVGSLQIRHDPRYTEAAHAIAGEVKAMKACVERRLELSISLTTVVQWPSSLGSAEVAGGKLILPESPYWNVAPVGVGHYLRQTRIATALAQYALLQPSNLRVSKGSEWWSRGVPGAIGLLCLADVEGLFALRQVLVQRSDMTSQALVGSEVPVGPVARAPSNGWVNAYAPMAALVWTAGQLPRELREANQRMNAENSPFKILRAYMRDDVFAAAFGPPRVSEPASTPQKEIAQVKRWAWRDNGWQHIATGDAVKIVCYHGMAALRVTYLSLLHSDDAGLLLDRLPSIPRSLAPATSADKNCASSPSARTGARLTN